MHAVAWVDVSIGVVAGLFVSAALGWFFLRRSIREPRIVVTVDEVPIVSDIASEKIAVTFDGDRVPRLTASSIRVANRGRGVFRRADHMDPQDPIGVSLADETQVLDIRFDAVSQAREVDVNHRKLVEGPESSHALVPNYLNAGEEFVVTMTHTATVGVVRPVGTVVGAGPVHDGKAEKHPSSVDFPFEGIMIGVLLSSAIAVVVVAILA